MTPRAAVWTATVVLALTLLPAAASSGTEPSDPPVPQGPPLLIGDSIAHSVAGRFERRHPDFVVDAVPGRRIVSLTPRLRKDIAAYGVPSRLVVEMGTNTAARWSKADFEAGLDLLPVGTPVVMVTPYVRPNHGSATLPRGTAAAARTRLYAQWEHELAATMPHVCVDPWRETVERRPGLLTSMGVHPDKRGKRVFLRLLDTTLARCH